MFWYILFLILFATILNYFSDWYFGSDGKRGCINKKTPIIIVILIIIWFLLGKPDILEVFN